MSVLFRWPRSISIRLSPRSVTAGVRPFPLAMQHFYSLVSHVICLFLFPRFRACTAGVRPFRWPCSISTHLYPMGFLYFCLPGSVGAAQQEGRQEGRQKETEESQADTVTNKKGGKTGDKKGDKRRPKGDKDQQEPSTCVSQLWAAVSASALQSFTCVSQFWTALSASDCTCHLHMSPSSGRRKL